MLNGLNHCQKHQNNREANNANNNAYNVKNAYSCYKTQVLPTFLQKKIQHSPPAVPNYAPTGATFKAIC